MFPMKILYGILIKTKYKEQHCSVFKYILVDSNMPEKVSYWQDGLPAVQMSVIQLLMQCVLFISFLEVYAIFCSLLAAPLFV